MVYTLDIPAHVESALRAQGAAKGKSLDEVLIETLAKGAGVPATEPMPRRDLSFMRSNPADADEIDRVHEEWFERIDDERNDGERA